ncbi:hypothetical protein D3C73_879480 [compost metagenome]
MRGKAHVLLATGHHHIGIAGKDRLGAECDRTQARAADLVDGECRGAHRDACGNGCLAGGVLALTGAQHMAEHDIGNGGGFKLGPLESFADDDRAQLACGKGGKPTHELADRSAGGGNDYDIGHGFSNLAA